MEARDLAERNARLVLPMETMLATRVGLFEDAPEVATATTLGLYLNLLNVFLYMMNYNIVIPLLDDFCDHLHISHSTSGAVIGVADIMAIIVSVGYSIWTNYSFKQPLLFASITCLAGNVLVTLAYDWGGLPMLFIGRLLTGVGAARALNRRYIADFVSVEGRTTASIGFVAASAAGMAAGPFASVPLSSIFDRADDKWKLLGFSVNAITVSGWLMIVLWAAFWFTAVTFFEEPLKATQGEPGGHEGNSDEQGQQQEEDWHHHDIRDAAEDLEVLIDHQKDQIRESGEKGARKPDDDDESAHDEGDDEFNGDSDDVRKPLLSNGGTTSRRSGGPLALRGTGQPRRSASKDGVAAAAAGGDSAAPRHRSSDDGHAGGGAPRAQPTAFETAGASPSGREWGSATDLVERDRANGAKSNEHEEDTASDVGGSPAHAHSSSAHLSPEQIAEVANKRKDKPKSDDGSAADEQNQQADQSTLQAMRSAVRRGPRSFWQWLQEDRHTLPTISCTLMLFLLKLLQQGSVSATPLFAGEFFGWDKSAVGLFMAGMSLAMLPLNLSVASMTTLVRHVAHPFHLLLTTTIL